MEREISLQNAVRGGSRSDQQLRQRGERLETRRSVLQSSLRGELTATSFFSAYCRLLQKATCVLLIIVITVGRQLGRRILRESET